MRAVLPVAWRRFLAGFEPAGPQAGWATRSTHLAVRNAFLLAVLVFQGLVAVALVAEGYGRAWLVPILGAHAALALAAWRALRGGFPPGLLPVLLYAFAAVDIALTSDQEGVIVYSASWMAHLANALPSFFISGRRAFAAQLAGFGLYAAVVLSAHPDWGPIIVRGEAIAGFSIFLGTRAAVAVLAELTARADLRAAEAAAEAERAAWLRQVGQEAAEAARVLHDTVINTLAALASGGGAIRDTAMVRDRCRSDVATVTALLDTTSPPEVTPGPLDALVHTGLDVRRTGLDDDALVAALGDVPAVAEALGRAAYEVAQNAAKHAGVDEIEVDVRRAAGGVRVTVTDRGVGFDPARTALRGLATSVRQRAEAAGIEVDLTSAPGAGTTVVLTAPATSPPPAAHGLAAWSTDDLAAVVSTVRSGAVWMWSVGVLLAGIVLEVGTYPGRLTPTYLTLVLGAVAVLLMWRTRTASARVRRLVLGTLVVLDVVGLALSISTSDWAQVDPVLWQTVSTTGILLLLFVQSGSRAAGRWGLGAHLATAVVIAAAVAPRSTSSSLIVLTGGTIGVLLVLAFGRFDRAIGEIGALFAADDRALHASRVEAQERQAATDARARWRSAGLQPALALLDGIGSGRLDPADAEVRLACGHEESYLRQLIQLDPELVRMGPWFVRALSKARERQVRFAVRSGDREPERPADARALGRLVLAAVRTVPSDAELTVTLFGSSAGLTLTVVAPHPTLEPVADRWAAPAGATATFTPLGTQDLVEVRLPAPAFS
jgi:signal transduction histidine kinase